MEGALELLRPTVFDGSVDAKCILAPLAFPFDGACLLCQRWHHASLAGAARCDTQLKMLNRKWLTRSSRAAAGPLLSLGLRRLVGEARPQQHQRQHHQHAAGLSWLFALFATAAYLVSLLRSAVRPRAQYAPPRGAAPPRATHHAPVSAVHKLKLETFATAEELRALPVRTLKTLLLEAQRAAGKEPEPFHLAEKSELVARLLALRNADSSAGSQCAVCLEAYESGVLLRVLPCGHRFHVECIDSWLLRRSAACPYCSSRVAS